MEFLLHNNKTNLIRLELQYCVYGKLNIFLNKFAIANIKNFVLKYIAYKLSHAMSNLT
jgi:hypothetical protein